MSCDEWTVDHELILAASWRVASLFLGPDNGADERDGIEDDVCEVIEEVIRRGLELDKANDALSKYRLKPGTTGDQNTSALRDQQQVALYRFCCYDVEPFDNVLLNEASGIKKFSGRRKS